MALIEDITEEQGRQEQQGREEDVLAALNELSERLALPPDLLPSFLQEDKPEAQLASYRQSSLSTLQQMIPGAATSPFLALSTEEQAQALHNVFRLYGTDDWTSSTIKQAIDELTSPLDRPALALHLLTSLRPVFAPTPHPMLNTSTSRALPRPAGGPDAQRDFSEHEAQAFKQPSSWGTYNILKWCAAALPASEVEKRVGLLLPPTLILMDDWEPAWRARGVGVLASWMDKLPSETMRRMGIDKLLFDSLVHTLSLHSSPPLEGVLPVALRLVQSTKDGKSRAEAYSQIVEKGIIQGWTYAPSGMAGRPVLVSIASDLEELCHVLKSDIVRWLKTIIPSLLDPLQYTPTPAVAPHYKANLSALLCVLRTVRETGRVARWRGQILDVCSRLWIQLGDRGEEMQGEGGMRELKRLISDVFSEIAQQCPSVREVEFVTLAKVDPTMVPQAA